MRLMPLGRWQAGWDVNYIDKSKLFNDVQPEELSINRVKAELYHDLNVRFAARDNIELYAGVNNVTDNKPPRFFGIGTTHYDAVGRYYYAGGRVSLR